MAYPRNSGTTLSKTLEITLVFWIIKIAATTLGETAGDAVTMTMTLNREYLIGTAIFVVLFVVGIPAQIAAKRFHPLLHWTVIIATTTAGPTLADLFDRSLGIGYVGGSFSLFALLLATLGLWYRTLGSVSVRSIVNRKPRHSIG